MTEENGLSWSCKADLPAIRFRAASAVHEGRIWVVGGYVRNAPSVSVVTYDAEGDTWEAGPPLPSPRADCHASSIDGGILLQTEGAIFQYKNAAWARAEEPGGAAVPGATCGSVLLG